MTRKDIYVVVATHNGGFVQVVYCAASWDALMEQLHREAGRLPLIDWDVTRVDGHYEAEFHLKGGGELRYYIHDTSLYSIF